jgi:hypothetical protein
MTCSLRSPCPQDSRTAASGPTSRVFARPSGCPAPVTTVQVHLPLGSAPNARLLDHVRKPSSRAASASSRPFRRVPMAASASRGGAGAGPARG